MQYQQQEQSVSSDSLVQLDEKLKQPLLTEIDDVEGKSAAAAAGASSSLTEVNNEAETSKEDAESSTAAATKKEGNDHDKTDEQKIDDDKNEKSTTENVHVGTDEESSTQSSQKSNTNDKDDTSSNETTTAPFISPDRATMSMSPSLLMNNNNNRGEELTPSPPSLLQQQQQQQHDQSPPLHHQQQQGNNNINIISSPSRITYASPPGRRTIKLRLLEEIPSSLPPPNKPTATPTSSSSNRKTPFKSFRQIGRIRSLSLTGSLTFPYLNEDKSTTAESESGATTTTTTLHHDPNGNSRNNNNTMLVMDRGTITVSWYDGTTSSEMQEHVFGCVLRKLNQSGGSSGGGVKLEDVRLLDENVEPHEEVVLCPFLPDGSQFLLRFRTVEDKPERTLSGTHNNNAIHHHYQQHHRHPFASRAPDSPSAEPSPHPSNANLVSLGGMNSLHPQQLQVLNAAAAALLRPPPLNLNSAAAAAAAVASSSSTTQGAKKQQSVSPPPPPQVIPKDFSDATTESTAVPDAAAAAVAAVLNGTNPNTTAEEQTDDLIEQQLRQLNELFLRRRAGVPGAQFPKSTSEGNNFAEEEQYHREEKKQVIFLIGNYLVLFMSLIALSAEIQSRLPQMMKWVQENYDSVQNCATDRDALVDCLSKGDFSGLVASFLLWATQSVAAKRVFLFGFDTPKKLWTVVYEALVSAVCWGISYLFIRRGLNPNTRQNFVHKYWKDAVYGSLAGFNAAFLKAVLKNLVPQDVALEALEGRQLRIFHWLGTLLADE